MAMGCPQAMPNMTDLLDVKSHSIVLVEVICIKVKITFLIRQCYALTIRSIVCAYLCCKTGLVGVTPLIGVHKFYVISRLIFFCSFL